MTAPGAFKKCPKCGTAEQLSATQCPRCGHLFRTQFPQVNQTQAFTGPLIDPAHQPTVQHQPYAAPWDTPYRSPIASYGAPLDFEFWAKLIGVGFLTVLACSFLGGALFPSKSSNGLLYFPWAVLFILVSGVGYTKLIRRWPIGRTNVYIGMGVAILMGITFAISNFRHQQEDAEAEQVSTGRF